MAEQKKKETVILVLDEDRLKLKAIAEEEERTMKVMFKILLNFWEKNK